MHKVTILEDFLTDCSIKRTRLMSVFKPKIKAKLYFREQHAHDRLCSVSDWYKSTSVLLRMPFSDWLRHLLYYLFKKWSERKFSDEQ